MEMYRLYEVNVYATIQRRETMDLINHLGGYLAILPNDIKGLLVLYLTKEDKTNLAASLFITTTWPTFVESQRTTQDTVCWVLAGVIYSLVRGV